MVLLFIYDRILFVPGWRSKGKRLKAYRDIIAALNDTTGILLNETELKIKIKNLRSTYSQEVSKIKQRSGPNWTYTPNMKWFGEWHKCFSVLKKPTEDSSFDSQQDISEDTSPKIWLSQNEEHLQDETLDPFPDAEEEYNLILKPEPREVPNINIDRSFVHTANLDSRYENKRKKIKLRSPSTDCLNFTEITDSNTDCGEKDDEFDIYGKYIASQLRKMDLQRALRLQLEIQSLVSEARISDLNIK
ncbi:unnamed protein product [Arctia plantaginis]|uniref:MADF domain-containing protein n=1 Tax=Arctia plantaginis TaxID=874455 RepID=A0A8S1B0X1_ARCPL|nr:unnamed protein product [Arctia plantaginis]